MNALIIIAHGSRRTESNQEVVELTEKVRQQASSRFSLVEHAFLELAQPDLPSVLDKLVEQGVDTITVLPYFLNSGNHVMQDIPALLDAAKSKHPSCNFLLVPAIGKYEGMPELILQGACQT